MFGGVFLFDVAVVNKFVEKQLVENKDNVPNARKIIERKSNWFLCEGILYTVCFTPTNILAILRQLFLLFDEFIVLTK